MCPDNEKVFGTDTVGSIHGQREHLQHASLLARRYSPENPGRAAQSFARYIEKRYAVQLSATQIG